MGRPIAMSHRPHICFVAPTVWPVFSGDRRIQVVGGAEVQQSYLLREFVRRGYPVSMICMDYGQSDPSIVDGVTVHCMHAPDSGLRVVRFLYPRLTSLWAAMHRANADIYYQRTSDPITGFIAAFCRSRRRLSVYAAAHDWDFDPDLPQIRYGRDRMLFRWGLRNVSGVVVQSERQREALARHYGRDATVVPSCYGYTGKRSCPGGIILWAGTGKRIKRPELFIDLARRCPQYRFRLVGGGARDEGGSFDRDARWQGHAIGEIVGSLDDMATCVQSLMSDEERWRRVSSVCREYFAVHHSVDRAVDAYEAVFDHLIAAADVRTGTSALGEATSIPPGRMP